MIYKLSEKELQMKKEILIVCCYLIIHSAQIFSETTGLSEQVIQSLTTDQKNLSYQDAKQSINLASDQNSEKTESASFFKKSLDLIVSIFNFVGKAIYKFIMYPIEFFRSFFWGGAVYDENCFEQNLDYSTKNVEDDLLLIDALKNHDSVSLAQKEEMIGALIDDLASLQAQSDQRTNLEEHFLASKKKIKLKKNCKKSGKSIGGVERLLTPQQAREAIEKITADMIDVEHAKSLDEHFAEMIELSGYLDPRVKADVAAKKAIEYIKNNKYLLTKEMTTWEKVSKGPFILAAYNALPKSTLFVELYQRDAELFKKVLQDKDRIKKG